MTWFLIVVVLAIAYVALYWMSPRSGAHLRGKTFQAHGHERDPVCGKEIDVASAGGRREYDGRIWWFCSIKCRDEFDAHPQEYTRRSAGPPATPLHEA